MNSFTEKDGMTSLQAIAEVLHNSITPQAGQNPYKEIEDVIEVVRNAYQDILYQVYMANFAQGDRSIPGQYLNRKRYNIENAGSGSFFSISDITVVSLPRDAGIVQVIPILNKNATGKPYIRTNASMAFFVGDIPIQPRYYPIATELHFPDGHAECAEQVEVVYYGVPDNELIRVPRDLAFNTMRLAWPVLAPGREIPEDITNNQNSNG